MTVLAELDKDNPDTEHMSTPGRNGGNCLGVALCIQLNEHKTLKGLRQRLYCN